MYDDEPEDSYSFFDDEKAVNSVFDNFGNSRKWESASERKKREEIEALKEE